MSGGGEMIGGELLTCGPSRDLDVVFMPKPAENALIRKYRAPANLSFGASRLRQKIMGNFNSSSDNWLPGFNYTSGPQCQTTSSTA